MGNSEVGHLNLGAGAVVMQDLTRIDEAVADGRSGGERGAARRRSRTPQRVHLIGLVSDGGVHSGCEHLEALIELGGRARGARPRPPRFTDGRDTLPHSGAGFLETVEGWMDDAGAGRDRLGRRALLRDGPRQALGPGPARLRPARARPRRAPRADAGRRRRAQAYERGETDEFITPTLVGESEARIRPGDSVFAFNFRPDRMREITRALAEPAFADVDRGGAPVVERYATMTEYEEGWPYPVAFPPAHPATTLPHVLAARGVRQLHVAETEKYPHVTYFFNGGEETPCDGERRELVASPRDVPTYDHKPEMSARAGRRRVRRRPGARTRRRSGSSTSPTPTWSGTPA